MNNIQALLLAGGDSSRFWPGENKCCQYFLSKPLIYYTLSQLKRFGINDVLIIVNSENSDYVAKIASNFTQMKITLVLQHDIRGMAGAILSAKKNIRGNQLLLISPTDIYEDYLLDDFGKSLKSDPDAIIAGMHNDTYFPGGYLDVEEERIIGIKEKPPDATLKNKYVNFVFHYFKHSDILLKELVEIKGEKDDLYEQVLDRLMKKHRFKLLIYKGYWGYLKYPWHILGVCSYFLNKIKGIQTNGAVIDKSAVLQGDIYLENNVRVLENAKIIGPAYIGQGTVIGNGTMIRESSIGNNCVIGFGTEVARSYIGDNCWFHSNYIGDSIIFNDVSMGAGSVLANLRLDEKSISSDIKGAKVDTGRIKFGSVVGKGVRIGVNCSIMPGVKIGNNSLVGAGVILEQDLPEQKFCKVRQQRTIITNSKISISQEYRRKQKNLLESL